VYASGADRFNCPGNYNSTQVQDKVIYAWFIASPCKYPAHAKSAAANGAGGVMLGFPVPDAGAMFQYTGMTGGLPPVFHVRSIPGPFTPLGQRFPISLVAFGAALTGNLSLTLTMPEDNVFWRSWLEVPGDVSAVMYVGLAALLVSLTIVIWKLALFISFEGGIKFSIAQIALFTCWLGCIFSIYPWALVGEWGLFGPGHTEGMQMFEYFPTSWMMTVTLILGLYFREIGTLTQSASGGLGKMTIPAIIILSLLWAATITLGFLNVFEPQGAGGSDANGQFGQFYLAVICVVSAGTIFIICWGAITLVSGLGFQSNKGAAFRIIFLSAFCMICSVGFGLAFTITRVFIADVVKDLSEFETWIFWVAINTVVPAVVYAVVALNFRVQVAKEIEISKSGTSSTSSSSSSGSSSSSSSSSQADPVIEL